MQACSPKSSARSASYAEAAKFILTTPEPPWRNEISFGSRFPAEIRPRPFDAELARIGQDLPWDRMFFTFGDERCVPPDDLQSNYRMARESLFVPAWVPEKSVARMRGEIDPQIAAQEYQESASRPNAAKTNHRHDLILLGLGDDGHTASLFPGTAALQEKVRKVVANFVPKLNAWRITFTFPLISQARRFVFWRTRTKMRRFSRKCWEGISRTRRLKWRAEMAGSPGFLVSRPPATFSTI